MINWLHKEEGSCEGVFESKFFCNDENEKDLFVYTENPNILDYAEKCVEAFNNLTNSEITKICKKIIKTVKKENDDFELPHLENKLDILNYCWFMALYVSIPDDENKISYIVEGEGEWGDVIGFVVKNNKLSYVGTEYFEFFDEE